MASDRFMKITTIEFKNKEFFIFNPILISLVKMRLEN